MLRIAFWQAQGSHASKVGRSPKGQMEKRPFKPAAFPSFRDLHRRGVPPLVSVENGRRCSQTVKKTQGCVGGAAAPPIFIRIPLLFRLRVDFSWKSQVASPPLFFMCEKQRLDRSLILPASSKEADPPLPRGCNHTKPNRDRQTDPSAVSSYALPVPCQIRMLNVLYCERVSSQCVHVHTFSLCPCNKPSVFFHRPPRRDCLGSEKKRLPQQGATPALGATKQANYSSLMSMVFCSSISTTSMPSFSSCFIISEKRLKPMLRSLKLG